MEILLYIIQVSLSWLVFFGFYHFFLRKETFFNTNRWYLLFALISGLIVPYLLPVFRGAFEATVTTLPTYVITLGEITIGDQNELATQNTTFWTWQNISFSIYIIGFLFATGRFFKGIFNIIKIKNNGISTAHNGYSIIRTSENIMPFSFGKWLFLPQETSLSDTEEQQVIEHELVHIRARHSLDLIIVESITILFWFNPLLRFFRNALKEVHEYAADKVVLKKVSVKYYGQLLLQQAFPNVELALVHKFSQSQLKNRIKMMTQKPSSQSARAKYLFAAPLFLLVLITFSAYKYAETIAPQKSVAAQETSRILAELSDNSMIGDTNVYSKAEEMPILKDCSSQPKEEQDNCTQSAMIKYVYGSLEYPKVAKNNSIEGLVVVQFVVNKEGKMDRIKLLRDIGGGCGQAAVAAVQKLADDENMKWEAGIQKGKKVNVQFSFPFRFKLSKDEKNKEENKN